MPESGLARAVMMSGSGVAGRWSRPGGEVARAVMMSGNGLAGRWGRPDGEVGSGGDDVRKRVGRAVGSPGRRGGIGWLGWMAKVEVVG